jgi:gamma-glutamylputrescine oxidase
LRAKFRYELSPVLEINTRKPDELITPGGRLQADHVFVAANGYTPRLGILKYHMLPVHQYTMATRELTAEEIRQFGLGRWPIRFEMAVLPITCGLLLNSRFFVRIVLGYASFNSCNWRDIDGAEKKVKKIIEKRYPWLSDIGLTTGWHGLTGHTLNGREIASAINQDNIHASVAYNGLGIMPGHNNGFLSACRIVGQADEDMDHLVKPVRHYPIPGEIFRSMMSKPFMKIMTPY